MGNTHYAWDCIHELEGQRLISMPEKERLCEKISRTVKKPSTALVIAVKVIPVLMFILTFVGMMLTKTTPLGWVILAVSILYLVAALFLFLLKEVWAAGIDVDTAEEEFADTYRIPEETFKEMESGKLTCYYYKGAREKYKGPCKIFYLENLVS